METILLRYFLCMMGVIGVINLITCLFWLWREFFRIWREKEAKQKEGCQQQEKRIWLPEPPVILTPNLGDNHLRIDFNRNPNLIFFGEEIISPYITERDYNKFVLSLQKAGVECEIEKGEDNGLDSSKYWLKKQEQNNKTM